MSGFPGDVKIIPAKLELMWRTARQHNLLLLGASMGEVRSTSHVGCWLICSLSVWLKLPSPCAPMGPFCSRGFGLWVLGAQTPSNRVFGALGIKTSPS